MANARDVGRALTKGTIPTGAAGGALRRVLEIAIDGVSKLPSAKSVAARQLQHHGDVEAAITALVAQHIRLASAQGFVTNVGGLVSQVVTVPANLAGVAVVQIRLVAAIAHLRGYDVNDPRVRTGLMMCLLGGEEVERRVKSAELPTVPIAVATAPVFDPTLDALVADTVLSDLLAKVGGKRMALVVSRRVPLLGGGVGAVMDGLTTRAVGRYASEQFAPRRRVTPA